MLQFHLIMILKYEGKIQSSNRKMYKQENNNI